MRSPMMWMGFSALGLALVGCSGEAPVVVSLPAPTAPASAPAVIVAAPTAAPAASVAAAPGASAATSFPTPEEILAALPDEGTVDLGKGDTLTIGKGGQITITGPNGKKGAESHCAENGWTYRKAVRLFAELQAGLRAADKEKVASLVAYPLRLNQGVGKSTLVKDAKSLVRDFDRVFTPTVSAKVLAADPRVVFCRYDGFMLGDGVVWAMADKKDRHQVFVINP